MLEKKTVLNVILYIVALQFMFFSFLINDILFYITALLYIKIVYICILKNTIN